MYDFSRDARGAPGFECRHFWDERNENVFLSMKFINNYYFFSVHIVLGLITLFVQYYSAFCRPTVGEAPRRPGPTFEPGTGRLETGTLTTTPPFCAVGVVV